ncbi:MAG: acetyl-CoA C-acyltransferase [Bacteroidia bacterium]|nr:acetyl-CoA C-acyltransferase [Bacteroidia bacterium]
MDAYIFDAIRSPRGKGSAKKGALRNIKPVQLLSQLYGALEERNSLDAKEIESVILGCVGQLGGQGADIAKVSTLYHGWGDHIEGMTVNTFCSSGMTAISLAAAKVAAGMSDMVLAGGIEMLSQVPMFSDKGSWFADEEVAEKTAYTMMGVSADLIATIEGFEQDELNAYALQSHQRAASATRNGFFKKSLIPIKNAEGKIVLDVDECIRPQTTLEDLNQLEPIFESYTSPSIRQKIQQKYPIVQELKHRHTIGNSPSMADGASVLLIGSLEKGKALALTPRAKIRAFDSTACEPIIMLLGGQYSAQKAIQKAGLSISDIGLHNFAEAFSASCLKYQRDLAIDPDRFNVNGGTMTMGHAQGASGAMISTTLLEEMERRDEQFGLASISGGAGLGAALLLERI